MTTAISVDQLSKVYKLGQIGTGTLRDDLRVLWAKARGKPNPLLKIGRENHANRDGETIWALKDVSLSVARGEVLGIIGRNGAGKTTLLKILSRVTAPTCGEVKIKGRVASLLEVGTGFHPELTGRENTYLNGAILGMKRDEIDRKFDEIVDFSGVEQFIDTPVKRYSSGMYVRLAFAVAAHLEPEILLVDEVLAVGDARFQKKCLGKMRSVAGEGRTVLFVSHNMESIMGLCSRAIWLDRGALQADGPAPMIVRQYLDSSLDQISQASKLADRTDRMGDGQLRFTGFHLRNQDGKVIDAAIAGDTVEFVLSYVSGGEPIRNVDVLIWILDDYGRYLMCLWTKLTGEDFKTLPPSGEVVCRVPRFPLSSGSYFLEFRAMVNHSDKADHIYNAAVLEVASGDYYGTGRSLSLISGFLCDYSWRLDADGSDQKS